LNLLLYKFDAFFIVQQMGFLSTNSPKAVQAVHNRSAAGLGKINSECLRSGQLLAVKDDLC